jgi:hypothetical protein
MDQDRRGILGEVGDARLVDGRLVVANRPSGTLGLLVDRAGDLLDLVRFRVVVVAADDALGIDGEREDIVGGLGTIIIGAKTLGRISGRSEVRDPRGRICGRRTGPVGLTARVWPA